MTRRRSALLPTASIVAVLVVGFIIFTNVWTDRLWFVSLGFEGVFTTMLGTRLGLFAGFGLLLAALVVGNLYLVNRLRPSSPTASGSELLERYRDVVGGRFGVVLVVVGVIVALFGGGAGAAQVLTFQGWLHGTEFGVTDPKFGLDVGFFVFDYPWWRFVLSFVFTSLVFTAIVSGLLHFLLGALRMAESGAGDRRQLASPAAQAHLSVLVGAALVVKAGQYWLDRYGTALHEGQLLTGITYTSDTVGINALVVLTIISLICSVMFFANAVLRRWAVPLIGLVLMVLSGLVLQAAIPAGVQAFTVNPTEPDVERPYIEQHIAATRQAFGVDNTEITEYDAQTTASSGQLREDADALPGIRLIDPAVVKDTFEQSQQIRGYYQFPPVLDVDRYRIDGTSYDAVVAVREINTQNLDQPSWNNLRTVFTHGYGMVAAYGNRKAPDGQPEWIVQGIPPTGELAEHQPRVYFGELHDDYSIVGAPEGAPPVELDTPGAEATGGNLFTYDGLGGVPIGSLFNRLLYAVKFGDVNILLSDRVNEASKIIYDRTPAERVQAAAPWLTIDSNAYPAIVDGRIVWIVDGYTTSGNYPNSQKVSLRDATRDSTITRDPTTAQQPNERINYLRNSVKAVVDAYDGTVKLYAWDTEDPILQAYQAAFPGSVLPKADISPALLEHLRYPEDQFRVQRAILARYHVTDPRVWYQNDDLWAIPQDPNAAGGNAAAQETPYYLSVRWPEEQNAVFSLTTTFVPFERANLAAFMAVDADGASPEYGRIRVLRMAESSRIDGPGQTFNAMNTDQAVADSLRPFLMQGAAQASWGNLLTLPVGGGLIYVAPVYVRRPGASGNYPVLQFVVVRFGTTVGIGTTLQEALDNVFAGDAGADTGETGNEGSGVVDNPEAVRALRAAEAAFTEAEAALREGDLATYQAKTREAQVATERALRAMGQG